MHTFVSSCGGEGRINQQELTNLIIFHLQSQLLHPGAEQLRPQAAFHEMDELYPTGRPPHQKSLLSYSVRIVSASPCQRAALRLLKRGSRFYSVVALNSSSAACRVFKVLK